MTLREEDPVLPAQPCRRGTPPLGQHPRPQEAQFTGRPAQAARPLAPAHGRLLGLGGSAGRNAWRAGGWRLEPHRGASCSTARCRPCPCAARSPGRRGPPSDCSNSAGPAAPRAPGRSARGSASGRSRALREEGALSARWGSACGPPEASGALAPGRQPPAPWAEETPSPQPGLFSLEEQRPAQLPLPLGPDGKLLAPEDTMPSHLTSRLPSVLGAAAASGRLPSTAGEHRSGHDYGAGPCPPCPSPGPLAGEGRFAHILAHVRLGEVKEPAGQAPSLSGTWGAPPQPRTSGPASGRREDRGQGRRPNWASSARRQTCLQ